MEWNRNLKKILKFDLCPTMTTPCKKSVVCRCDTLQNGYNNDCLWGKNGGRSRYKVRLETHSSSGFGNPSLSALDDDFFATRAGQRPKPKRRQAGWTAPDHQKMGRHFLTSSAPSGGPKKIHPLGGNRIIKKIPLTSNAVGDELPHHLEKAGLGQKRSLRLSSPKQRYRQ